MSACSAGTVSTMPTPMLKVLNISCSEMPPTFSIRWKSAGVRTSALRMRAQQLLQAAGDILIEAAAGDVGDALDIHLFQHLEHRLDVDLGGGQQGLAQRLAAQLCRGRLQDIGVVVDIKNLAHQRETVGVHTREAGPG